VGEKLLMLAFYQGGISTTGGMVKKVLQVGKNIGRDLLRCSIRQKINYYYPVT
jgi:hypothetical protein